MLQRWSEILALYMSWLSSSVSVPHIFIMAIRSLWAFSFGVQQHLLRVAFVESDCWCVYQALRLVSLVLWFIHRFSATVLYVFILCSLHTSAFPFVADTSCAVGNYCRAIVDQCNVLFSGQSMLYVSVAACIYVKIVDWQYVSVCSRPPGYGFQCFLFI